MLILVVPIGTGIGTGARKTMKINEFCVSK